MELRDGGISQRVPSTVHATVRSGRPHGQLQCCHLQDSYLINFLGWYVSTFPVHLPGLIFFSSLMYFSTCFHPL